jgi:tetratricopeptide (TPR) repeat protein
MGLIKKKRVGLILAVAVAAAAGIGALTAVRFRMIRHGVLVARDRGMQELKEGNNGAAAGDLRTYLGSYPDDVQALRAFAEARVKVEDAKGAYLMESIDALRRVTDLSPGDVDAERRLADLFVQASMNTECVVLTDKLLDRDGKDAAALHARALALSHLRKFDEALEVMERYVALKPGEFDAQLLRLELTAQAHPDRNTAEMAAGLRKGHPGEMQWKVLQSIACRASGDKAGAKAWALEAARSPAPEGKIAGVLVRQLWEVGAIAQGDAYLDQSVVQFGDETLRLTQARRMYQSGRFAELIALKGKAEDHPNFAACVKGYQALALMATGKKPEADRVRAALAADTGTMLAQEWGTVLGYMLGEKAFASNSQTMAVKEIAARRPSEGYFQYALGSGARANADYATEFKALQGAAAAEPAWAAPLDEMAATFLSVGRAADAGKAARAALERAGNDRDAQVFLALAAARGWDGGQSPIKESELLGMLDAIHAKYPDEERTTALRVAMKAQLVGKEVGKAALLETLGQKPAVSLETFLALAEVSKHAQLGEEEACFAAAEKVYGVTPEVTLSRAAVLADKGQVEAGKKLMEAGRANGKSADQEKWLAGYAQYLEMTHDPDAGKTWVLLGDTYPGDARAQWLVLAASSIADDREVTGKTIERLRGLIGEADFSFKLARARYLLGGKPGAAELSEATALLSETTKSAPDVLAPHLLLAECLERNENVSGAIEQLQIATALAPDAVPIAIELTRLLQLQGDMSQAGVNLAKLLERKDLTEANKRTCAAMLARQGDTARAAEILEKAGGTGADADLNRLILAIVYAQQGKTAEAGAVFDALMKHPNLRVIHTAADFYALHGRMEEANAALAKLPTLGLEPSVVAVEQGDFLMRFGKPEDALAAYERAVAAAPKDVQIWYRMIAMNLEQGNSRGADEMVDRALAKVPGDKILQGLLARRGYVDGLDAESRYRPVLVSLISSPMDVPAADEVLARINQGKMEGDGGVRLTADLSALADRYPNFAALQTLAAQMNVEQGHWDEAVAISTRAMQTFPTSADPARLAAIAFASTNRWTETLNASTQWRARSPVVAEGADVMIGMSYLGMGHPDDTLRQIEPYMAKAASDPNTYDEIILLYARSELAKGEPEAAEAKLWPLAKTSKRWLGSFMDLGSKEGTAETGVKWLTMAKGELGTDLEMHTFFANCAVRLYRRTGDKGMLTMAEGDLREAIAGSKSEGARVASAELTLAMVDEMTDDLAGAESAYRQAIALNPKLDVAYNNLAMVLAKKGDAAEASTYCNKAIELSPKNAAYQDTLAYVKARAGDFGKAVDHMQTAIRLEPQNVEWRINLSQIYLDAGQAEKAKTALVNADGTQVRGDQVAGDLKSKLSTLQQQLGM